MPKGDKIVTKRENYNEEKTLLIVSMLVLVMFALTACGSKSPKSVVEDNLKQIKTEKTSSNVSKLFNDKTLEQKYRKRV